MTTYNQLINQFADDPEAAISDLVAKALRSCGYQRTCVEPRQPLIHEHSQVHAYLLTLYRSNTRLSG